MNVTTGDKVALILGLLFVLAVLYLSAIHSASL
jgi:hypothetical protein